MRGLVTDRATYDYVLNLLAENEQPQFIFDVTMQNHGGYDVGGLSEEMSVSVPLPDGTTSLELNEYASVIRQADQDLAYLTEQLNRLAEGGAGLSFLDLKSQLPFLPAADRLGDCGEDTPDSRQLFDAGVAGYLLNPLKDTYDYDDLARDYLDMTVPSKGDLIGKQSFGDIFSEITMDLGQEASENGKEELNSGEQCLCYMAYTAWKSRERLTEKLKETGMEELFFSIEMPLIYSLFHMEQAGRVKLKCSPLPLDRLEPRRWRPEPSGTP